MKEARRRKYVFFFFLLFWSSATCMPCLTSLMENLTDGPARRDVGSIGLPYSFIAWMRDWLSQFALLASDSSNCRQRGHTTEPVWTVNDLPPVYALFEGCISGAGDMVVRSTLIWFIYWISSLPFLFFQREKCAQAQQARKCSCGVWKGETHRGCGGIGAASSRPPFQTVQMCSEESIPAWEGYRRQNKSRM